MENKKERRKQGAKREEKEERPQGGGAEEAEGAGQKMKIRLLRSAFNEIRISKRSG